MRATWGICDLRTPPPPDPESGSAFPQAAPGTVTCSPRVCPALPGESPEDFSAGSRRAAQLVFQKTNPKAVRSPQSKAVRGSLGK